MRYANHRFCNNTDEVIFDGVGAYDIPEIKPERWMPCEWIGFNFAATANGRAEKGVHFFVDDYQFERVWRDWKRYAGMLKQFKAVMTPDFSTYSDWPVAVQMWNHYRKHFVGAYLQQEGVLVYPTISWSDEKSYDWCFDGEPQNAVVCVSSVGTQKHADSKRLFQKGYDAMMERLRPETVIFYGEIPKECKGNILQVKAFQSKFNEAKVDAWL